MKTFKGYPALDAYPQDGWLKGYFYIHDNDIKGKADEIKGAYRDMDYIRHKDYLLHLLDIKQNGKVLDVGCADGAMMVYCGLLGAEVYGVDFSRESIEKANGYLAKNAIKGKAIFGDAKKLDFQENYFDKVVSCDFFEHLSYDDNVLVLKEIKRVLKPGGAVFIKTPNLTYLKLSKLFKQSVRILKFKNPLDVVIAETTGKNPQHIGLATKNKMAKAIMAAGFLNFNFFYDINSKIGRFNYRAGELVTQTPLLRCIFNEDLIAIAYKPIILSFFP